MPDFVLIDGDDVIFHPAFTPAFVSVKPGKLTATGNYNPNYTRDVGNGMERADEPLKAGVNGKRVCIEGDERMVEVRDCPYVTPLYSIAGVGTLKISSLTDHRAMESRVGQKPVLLKGSMFQAKFEVTIPARMPIAGPGAPPEDTIPLYTGSGFFQTANKTQKAT